jgi:hypothetical protein
MPWNTKESQKVSLNCNFQKSKELKVRTERRTNNIRTPNFAIGIWYEIFICISNPIQLKIYWNQQENDWEMDAILLLFLNKKYHPLTFDFYTIVLWLYSGCFVGVLQYWTTCFSMIILVRGDRSYTLNG